MPRLRLYLPQEWLACDFRIAAQFVNLNNLKHAIIPILCAHVGALSLRRQFPIPIGKHSLF